MYEGQTWSTTGGGPACLTVPATAEPARGDPPRPRAALRRARDGGGVHGDGGPPRALVGLLPELPRRPARARALMVVNLGSGLVGGGQRFGRRPGVGARLARGRRFGWRPGVGARLARGRWFGWRPGVGARLARGRWFGRRPGVGARLARGRWFGRRPGVGARLARARSWVTRVCYIWTS
jgi:hypothetical protein